MRSYYYALVGSAGLLFAACHSERIIEERTPSYRVAGRVTGPTGAAGRGTAVTVWAYSAPDCTGLLSGGGQATTDAAGRYAAAFGSRLGTFDGRVEARVVPPAGATVAAGAARGPVVHLEYARGDSAAVDVGLATAER